jgi:hypothetical protein
VATSGAGHVAGVAVPPADVEAAAASVRRIMAGLPPVEPGFDAVAELAGLLEAAGATLRFVPRAASAT